MSEKAYMKQYNILNKASIRKKQQEYNASHKKEIQLTIEVGDLLSVNLH